MVGLGNPGAKYEHTRHNIGFMALDKIADHQLIKFRLSKKLFGEIAEHNPGNKSQKLLKPTTYMNESGLSVRKTMDWFGINQDQILVIVDDIDLPLGKLRLRQKGSSGGHNGLKSIIKHIGSQEFWRLRVGIGSPSNIPELRKKRTHTHVLGSFHKNEESLISEVLNEIIVSLNLLEKVGIERASNYINGYRHESLEK